jgi:hypothetical protein
MNAGVANEQEQMPCDLYLAWMLMLCNVPEPRIYTFLFLFFFSLPVSGFKTKCLLFLADRVPSCLVPGALCLCVWLVPGGSNPV